MNSRNRKFAATIALSTLTFAVGTPSVAADSDAASTAAQTKPAMKKIDGPLPDAAAALERAQAKFARAMRIIDTHKAEVEASGVTGNGWRVEMLNNLMKGSVSDFALVEGAPTYGAAMSAAMRINMVAPLDLGDATYDLVYVPITPCRILDTRASGSVVPANTARTYYFHSSNVGNGGCSVTGQIPGAYGAAAFAANVTLDESGVSGFPVGSYLSIYPQGGSTTTSFMNFAPGQVIANAGVISVNQATGQFTVFSNAPTNQIIDTYGVFIEPQPTELECINTAFTEVSMGPNGGTANAGAPACASGYTETATNCETTSWLSPIVWHSNGICSARNGDSSSHTLRASRRCCRIPGRN